MKKTTIALAIAAAVLLLRKKAGATSNEVRVGDLGEGRIMDGTNWTGNMWDRLGAVDLKDKSAPNLNYSTTADPGKVGQASLGLQPGWDGSL